MQYLLKTIFILCCFCFYAVPLRAEPVALSTLKSGVVSVTSDFRYAAYEDVGVRHGSAFLVDKEKGLFLTNQHIVGNGVVATYNIKFFNGRIVDAYGVYSDPWHDFGFLKVDPKEIPDDVIPLSLAEHNAQTDDNIVIIGKNNGYDFSVQEGTVTDIYENMGHFSSNALRISLSAKGGASGSPVIGKKAQVVGVVFASDDDFTTFAVPISFAKDALLQIQKRKTPKRLHTGMILSYYSLDKIKKYSSFPEHKIKEFNHKYPQAFNRALQVFSILPGSPAEKILEYNDVLLKINDVEIGPDNYLAEKLMNESTESSVKMTISRRGEEKTFHVGLYDLNASRIKKLLVFAGGTFFESDDFIRSKTGTPLGVVFLCNIRENSSFDGVFSYVSDIKKSLSSLLQIQGHTVNSLSDFQRLIPYIKKKESFELLSHNYGYSIGYNNFSKVSYKKISDVTLYSDDMDARTFTFNEQAHYWEYETVN